MKTKIYSIIAIILAVTMWGISFLSIKITLNVFGPMTLATLRFLIASIILFVVMRIKEPDTKLQREDIKPMAMAGVFGVAIYYCFENYGIKYISSSEASLIIGTIPIFSLIVDSIILKNKLSVNNIIGVLLSMIGIYFIIGGNIRLGTNEILGYIFMFGAVFSWVFYNYTTKNLFKKYSQLAIVFYQIIFGTMVLIPFSLFENNNWELINNVVIYNFLYLAIFCSAISYVLYMYALENLGSTVTTLYLNFSPIVTVVGGYFVFSEAINTNQIIGTILIILSVYVVNLNLSYYDIVQIIKFTKINYRSRKIDSK
ncbi:DMT family transporter [Tepidibacter aestuarii]|uniref:DMT family transporter n=1 Tax=Tepidibacter aestuarii TaxID=2925782 RepID=UPI0020BE3E0D|nr:DMT family transporter [Tepidibacter aestuarii]CAH2212550.1 Permease of the drug/metabolite transporter (DMT) superfamily [Tepidibacter aestuarii]